MKIHLSKTPLWLSILFAILICFVLPQTVKAAPQPSLFLDGKAVHMKESILQMNNSVLVPVRVISEELGYKVGWEHLTKTITISNKKQKIILTVEKKEALVNNKEVKLEVPAKIVNGTTIVPLRFVGESMGLEVGWDNKTKTVYLTTPKDSASPGDKPDERSVQDLVLQENSLQITMDQDVQPKLSVVSDPDRIVIDIPNANFSNEFSEKFGFEPFGQGESSFTNHASVHKIRFSMFSTSPNTVRFVVDMKERMDPVLKRDGKGLITIELNKPAVSESHETETDPVEPAKPSEPEKPTKPTVPIKPKDSYTVVLDAGHGGKVGSLSVTNKHEDDLNLAITLKVAELAKKEPKLHILLTRDKDVNVALSERVAIANNANADLFVSIHANSVDNRSPIPNGTETLYTREESLAFAETMHSYLLQGTQFNDRGVKPVDLHVTRNTTMPAILLEIGFLTNPEEEAIMFTEQFQWRVAEQIVMGIKAQLGLL
jgi:N-acetylmuramoyl-L-alanine amidase